MKKKYLILSIILSITSIATILAFVLRPNNTESPQSDQQYPSTITTVTSTYQTEQTTTPTSQVFAGAYYVATTGNDSNNGSITAPYHTIQHAISIVPANSTILVTAGTYNERLIISGKSGLAIQNAPGSRPVLNGAGFSNGYLVDISGSDNIDFNGFEVCDFKGPELEGIIIRKASSNIEISDCIFHNIGTSKADGNAHVILVEGGSITPVTNIKIHNNEVYACKTGRSETITMESNVDGFSITNNKIHDVDNIAIDVTGFYDNGVTLAAMNQARNGIISNNLIYNLFCPYASCAGIYVDGGKNITIEQNTVHDSMYGIEIGCENPYDEVNKSVRAIVSGIVVRFNLVYNNKETGISIGGYNGTRTGQVINSQVYNNTFFKNNTELELSYCDNVSLSKNIFFSAGGSNYFIYNDPSNAVTNLKMDNNCYFSENGSGNFEIHSKDAQNLPEWRVISGQDMKSQFVDPRFINPVNFNFKLQASSAVAGIGAR